jgi:large subunit ribosomal protein L18
LELQKYQDLQFIEVKRIYAQVIDDIEGTTLVSASSLDKDFEGIGSNKEAAKVIRRNYC